MRQKIFVRHALIAIVFAALVAGCSGPERIRVDSLPSKSVSGPQSADQLLAEAAGSYFPDSASLTLQATALLIDSDANRAKSILDGLVYESLPDDLKETLALQQARISDQTQQNADVFHWLDRKAIINSPNRNTAALAHTLRAKAYNRYAEYTAALDEWLIAMPLLTNEQKALYANDFWQTLLRVPLERLQALNHQTPSGPIKGWLELAILYQPGTPLTQQLADLQRWLQQWPGHPGSAYIPKNLEQLQASAAPDKIAVLLPLSGSLATAGQSVLDGIIAANYQALHGREKNPELLIYDTHNNDVIQLADNAILAGAQLIIGPLGKENVSRLQTDIAARIPVLALNYLDTSPVTVAATQLYQFGLSTEDEARMVAHRATLDGHKRAIVLTPDSAWGKKVYSAFEQTWVKMGGEIAAAAEFTQNTEFSKLSGQLLQVDQSQQREKQLRRLLKESLGFQARRRQDVDMVFIAATAAEARQIKPAFSYQFAGNIPVYGTSSVFSGTTNTTRDQDIDGIRLPVMPWSIPGHASIIEKNITTAWPQSKGTYGALYALGADAYTLYPKLQQLANLPGSQIEGLTGWLSINPEQRINRQLTWQIFKNGKLTPLPAKQSYNHYARLAASKHKT